MNKIERWFLKRTLRRLMQRADHQAKIAELFWMIRVAAWEEFTEDNEYTRNAFLQGLFESSRTGDKK